MLVHSVDKVNPSSNPKTPKKSRVPAGKTLHVLDSDVVLPKKPMWAKFKIFFTEFKWLSSPVRTNGISNPKIVQHWGANWNIILLVTIPKYGCLRELMNIYMHVELDIVFTNVYSLYSNDMHLSCADRSWQQNRWMSFLFVQYQTEVEYKVQMSSFDCHVSGRGALVPCLASWKSNLGVPRTSMTHWRCRVVNRDAVLDPVQYVPCTEQLILATRSNRLNMLTIM